MTRELADWEKVLKLADKAYRSGRGLPSSEEELSWFTEQIRKYDFTPQQTTEPNYPHMQCYPSLGSPDDYDSTTKLTAKGLEECLVVGGPKRAVWFDMSRDLIVRRLEFVNEGKKNRAREYTEVIQGPNGNWFPTRWSADSIDQPGGELNLPRVVHICVYQFDE